MPEIVEAVVQDMGSVADPPEDQIDPVLISLEQGTHTTPKVRLSPIPKDFKGLVAQGDSALSGLPKDSDHSCVIRVVAL